MVAPLRLVTAAVLKEGRVGLIGAVSRGARWWEVTLDCGHTQTRPARYRMHDSRRRRTRSDVLPAPPRVRCDRCDRTPVTAAGRRWSVLVDGWDEFVLEADDLAEFKGRLAGLVAVRFALDGADSVRFASGDDSGDGTVCAGDEVIATFVWRPADDGRL